MNRRELLQSLGGGFGSLAFAAMAGLEAAPVDPLAPRKPHFPAKAKRVILLWMQGGPSQMDLFDYKPRLKREAGGKIPFSVNSAKERYEEKARLMPPVAEFSQKGQCGLWMSDLMPNLATKVDELCWLRAMVTDSPAHPGAIRLFQTGSLQFVRPSMGSWITYGLGTENRNLPGFVVISPMLYGDDGSPLHYSNVFLPAIYQGTRLGDARTPVKNSRIGYLGDASMPENLRRQHLDLIQARNRMDMEEAGANPEIEGLIQSYELAFRMQTEAPDTFDVMKESEATRELYGIGNDVTDNFGRKCLMARRLAEAGVRYIQVTDNGWDHHSKISQGLRKSATQIDKPLTGLLTDLKARGLLEDTLVIWTGEFGRTPYDQSLGGAREDAGRDHNPYCWTMFLAGAGVKQGMILGETDEYAWKAVSGQVHVHDLHATILHLLGLDHEKLTYRYNGRDFRLTDVYGNVVKQILS
ncbi:MAG: DUF1501 domain-containing protein [Acidobacteria bacterium]|nr:DUF1501 domain-containing protein [Acidobacteriota bacterium]